MSLKTTFTKLGLLEEQVEAPKSKTKQTAKATPAVGTPVAQPTYQPAQTLVDPAISASLEQSLQENKLSGFDYLKFIATVEEMKSTGTPEDARFKMAFVAAKQLGVDKDSLMKSGQHYVDVLKQDEADFNSDCAQFEKKEIQGRDANAAKLEAQIGTLTQQLLKAQADLKVSQSELEEKKSTLESRKAAFQGALEDLESTIQTNISKINQYL